MGSCISILRRRKVIGSSSNEMYSVAEQLITGGLKVSTLQVYHPNNSWRSRGYLDNIDRLMHAKLVNAIPLSADGHIEHHDGMTQPI